MCKNVIGIVLAVTFAGCLAIATGATARDPKLQSEGANHHAMRMDGCPYYPSPVFCGDASTAHTTASGAY
jgi:hypothetical protein